MVNTSLWVGSSMPGEGRRIAWWNGKSGPRLSCRHLCVLGLPRFFIPSWPKCRPRRSQKSGKIAEASRDALFDSLFRKCQRHRKVPNEGLSRVRTKQTHLQAASQIVFHYFELCLCCFHSLDDLTVSFLHYWYGLLGTYLIWQI